ncbi:MAG: STAS domain-containing protein [Pseudomonadota bacterium]
MQLNLEWAGAVLVVTVTDPRIDAASAVDFKDGLRKAVPSEAERIVLDLSQVDFIDSSGLGAIVAATKALGPNQPLELAGLTPKVASVFELTRMDSFLTIHATRSAALAVAAANG